MSRVIDIAIERSEGDQRTAARDHVVVEAPLQLRARGVPVATIMRTPGNDLELVRGLLRAESHAPCAARQEGEDGVELDTDEAAFARRGLLASAACGVCGCAAIADLETRAKSVDSDAGTTLAE